MIWYCMMVVGRRYDMSRQLPVLRESERHQTGHLSARDAGHRLRGAVYQKLWHGRRLRWRSRCSWTTTATWWRHRCSAPAQVLLQRLWMDLPAADARLRRSANKTPTQSVIQCKTDCVNLWKAVKTYSLLVLVGSAIFEWERNRERK